jgi:small nuclear ribonucleoprotein (snRNP)-like protein
MMETNENKSELDKLIGREVVIDVASQYVYLGKLTGCDLKYLILEQADVHDLRDTTTSRELYVVDSKRFGIRTNRERVLVRVGEIVSISALEDVIV